MNLYSFSAAGYFIIGIFLQIFLLFLKKKKFQTKWPTVLSTLDILPVYWWFVLYIATGQYFAYSPIIYIFLAWLVFGLFIATYLLWLKKQTTWTFVSFFHKYWQWTGLIAFVLAIPFILLNIF